MSRVSLITADVLLGLATWYKLSAGGMRRKAGTFAYTLLMDGEPHPPSPPELGMLTVCLCQGQFTSCEIEDRPWLTVVLTAIHDRALSLLNTLHLVLTLLSVRYFGPPSFVLPHRRTDSIAQFGTQHENVSVVTDFTEP